MKNKIFIVIICAVMLIINALPVKALNLSIRDFSNCIQSGHTYLLRNVYSDLYLAKNDVTSSVLYQYNSDLKPNTIYQKFKFILVEGDGDDAYYSIIPADNENVRFDITNAQNRNGTKVKTFQHNKTYSQAQLFRFIDNGDGSYRIMPKLSKTKVLEVTGPSKNDNADIQIWDYVGADNQKWILIDLDDTPEKQIEFYCEPDTYSKDTEYVTVHIKNNANYNLSYDSNYKIQKYNGTEWIDNYSCIDANEAAGYMIPNTESVEEFKISNNKVTLEAGKYRAVKRLNALKAELDGNELYDASNPGLGYIYYAEFEIK